MSTRTVERRQGTWSRLGWTVAALLVLFVAYVAGRAAGILLDLNPYATEVAATTLAVALLAWAAARGRDRRNTGPMLIAPTPMIVRARQRSWCH